MESSAREKVCTLWVVTDIQAETELRSVRSKLSEAKVNADTLSHKLSAAEDDVRMSQIELTTLRSSFSEEKTVGIPLIYLYSIKEISLLSTRYCHAVEPRSPGG